MSNLSNTDIIILAGGLGKRLRSVTGGSQKVLAEIDGKPFITFLMEYIASQGGQRFILCTGHGADKVEEFIQKNSRGLEIIFSREEEPLGTGGAIKKGSSLVKSEIFIAMNGDCFCGLDYNALIDFHKQHKAQAAIAVTKIDDARQYGTIKISPQKQIIAFKEKQPMLAAAFINAGTYCLNHRVFSTVQTPEKFSMEYDFFPHLVGKGFYAFEVENKFIDIGTPERYAWARENLKKYAIRF